jgi:hypothetical protein
MLLFYGGNSRGRIFRVPDLSISYVASELNIAPVTSRVRTIQSWPGYSAAPKHAKIVLRPLLGLPFRNLKRR